MPLFPQMMTTGSRCRTRVSASLIRARSPGIRKVRGRAIGRERYLDHYRYTPEDLGELYDAAEREHADCLVTTEKDAVRISGAAGSPLPVYYLRLEIEIIRGAADFDEAVGRICFPQNALAGSAPADVIDSSK